MFAQSFRMTADGVLIEAFVDNSDGGVCVTIAPGDQAASRNGYAVLSPLAAYMLGEALISMSESNDG